MRRRGASWGERRRTVVRAALGTVAGCASGSGGGAAAQVVAGPWDTDERVVVTDFQRVTALARSPDRLFAATDGGLAVMSDAFRRWELPVTREDGWPEAQVLSLAWDGRDATLWLGTRDGRLLQFDVFSRRWRDELRVGFAPTRIVPAVDDASRLYVRGASRWQAVDPFSRDASPVGAAVVQRSIEANFDLRAREELLRDPRFEAARPFLGRRGTRRYEVTDVMPAAGTAGSFWVATYGGFLELYDGFGGQGEPVAYGVVGLGAGAVLADGDTMWFAPLWPTDRYGVAAADVELEAWATFGAESFGFDAAPADPVRAMVRGPGGIWAGGERGLNRWDGQTWHREPLGSLAGDAPVTALAAGVDGLEGIWVGTERGLFRVPGPGAGPGGVALQATGVNALAVVAGDLWVGTDAGLARIGGADAIPEAADAPPGRVGAIVADDDRLVAGIDRDVWLREPDGSWRRADPIGVLAAYVTALAASDGVVWIGSDEGLVAWDTGTDVVTTFSFAAGDLPMGPGAERGVFDIAVDSEGGVWAATPAGAVRLDTRW